MFKFKKFFVAIGMMLPMIWGNIVASLIVTTLDQVSITSEGLYVNIDGDATPIESLTLADDGYVVVIPSPMTVCPRCGCERYVNGRFCPVCNFPDDD